MDVYARHDMEKALDNLDLGRGDTVLVRADLRYLGMFTPDVRQAPAALFEALARRVDLTIGRRLAFPHAVVPFPLSDVGNCVSSSLPLALNRLEKRYGAVLMSGFGVGLSWGSTMLFRT